MFKKLALSLMLIYSTITISSTKYDKFLYKYKVIANDNSALGLINLYNAKQHLLTVIVIKFYIKDPTLHQHLIIENLQEFAYENSVARYEEGMIVIIIGEGKGSIINGELRKISVMRMLQIIAFI